MRPHVSQEAAPLHQAFQSLEFQRCPFLTNSWWFLAQKVSLPWNKISVTGSRERRELQEETFLALLSNTVPFLHTVVLRKVSFAQLLTHHLANTHWFYYTTSSVLSTWETERLSRPRPRPCPWRVHVATKRDVWTKVFNPIWPRQMGMEWGQHGGQRKHWQAQSDLRKCLSEGEIFQLELKGWKVLNGMVT